MKPLTIFEQNFQTATALLSLHRLLLEGEHNVKTSDFEAAVRECFTISDSEEIIVLLNDLTHALIREAANMKANFFKEKGLSLLLRQAVVAACSAMDTYLNDKIRENLITVFLTKKRYAPKELLDIQISLGQYLSIQDFDPPEERLKQLILSNFDRRTLANVNGINECFALLGIKNCWEKLEEASGQKQRDMRDRIEAIVKRRNDIIHRGDRPPVDDGESEVQNINYAWVHTHIETVRGLVLAADEVINEHMRSLEETMEI